MVKMLTNVKNHNLANIASYIHNFQRTGNPELLYGRDSHFEQNYENNL